MSFLQVFLLRPKNKYSILTQIFLSGKCNIVFLYHSSLVCHRRCTKFYKAYCGLFCIVVYFTREFESDVMEVSVEKLKAEVSRL